MLIAAEPLAREGRAAAPVKRAPPPEVDPGVGARHLGASPPNRYRIKDGAHGRVVTCVEAPTLEVRIERGLSVGAAAARSASPGTIYLDGAAQGEPFLDPERAVYNLDHHEGCVRAFTLAACEQAMVLLLKGLDLRTRDWTVVANDADFDTVLAIWVLLNHLELRQEGSRARRAILPLLRLEGVIDAHGLGLVDFCGFPPDLLEATRAQMDAIRAPELRARANASWDAIDLPEYVAGRLRAIDALVYPPRQFEDLAEIEELARAEIGRDSLAVVCVSKVGIYEAERELRRLHGRRLGIIAVQKNASTYTVRQVAPALPGTLDGLYTRLNLIDPASGGARSPNRWGGSEEIGGSPRTTGTRLSPPEIAEACRHAYTRPTPLDRATGLAGAVALSLAVMAAALAPVLSPQWTPGFPALLSLAPPDAVVSPVVRFAALLAGLAAALYLAAARHAPGLFGLRRPTGLDWWGLLPFALAGSLAGGVWMPAMRLPSEVVPHASWLGALALLFLPPAAELLFRGLVHGSLASTFPMQRAGGPWRLSAPACVSAALYAGWAALPLLGTLSLNHAPVGGAAPWVPIAGAFLFGVASAIARERSESVVPPILFHWIGVAAVLGLGVVARLLATGVGA